MSMPVATDSISVFNSDNLAFSAVISPEAVAFSSAVVAAFNSASFRSR